VVKESSTTAVQFTPHRVLLRPRENTRMVRDQISSEMWEIINGTYHKLRGRSAADVWAEGSYEFHDALKCDSLLFQGLTDGTLDYHLRSITRTASGQFSNAVEQLCGRLRAEIADTTIDEIVSEGLHEYLDRLQLRFIDIHKAIIENHVHQPAIDIGCEIEQQQQQQQQ